jgi:2-oxoglutarate ferredoxin oxidoreductase subunit alpha
MAKQNVNVKLMTGNEACAEAAIVAGMRFFGGYPITPSSEIAEVLARRLPEVGGIFVQMEDELASMATIIGASLAGIKSMTATSGPGFSLMQENIGYASMTEVPCVIINVQRGGPSTGLPTLPAQADVMQARWGTHGDHSIIVVAPSTVRETYDWTIKAFNLTEQYRIPVVVLLDQNDLDIPLFADFGTGYRYNVTGLSHDETGFPTNDPQKINALYSRLSRKLERYQDQIIEYKTEYLEDAQICIVAFGSSARSAYRAVRLARQQGIKVGIFQLFVIWPFPYKILGRLASQIKAFIVPEMNLGQIAHEVSCAIKSDVIKVNRVDGSLITPNEILERIKNVSV